jgi:phage terminase small subunit
MAKRSNSPPGDAPTTTQQAIDAAVNDPEVTDAPPIIHDPDSPMLAPEARRKLLGRLAEFEVQLLALAPLQRNFVMAYVGNPTDGAKAARKAGYSEKRAATTACELLQRPEIAAAVALGEQLREDRTMITSDRTLHELAIIAFSDITDYEFVRGQIRTRAGIPSYATRAISTIEYTETEFEDDNGKMRSVYKTKIRLWSKDTALRMLAVYQKLLSEPGVTVNQTVNDNRGQTHHHEHQHQTWQIGDRTMTF